MRASQQIENIYDVVLELLEENKKYRDNDAILVARIWSMQLGGIDNLKKDSIYDFLCEYIKEDTFLYSHESITRARRKAQQEFTYLRGIKWENRHGETNLVKSVIKSLAKEGLCFDCEFLRFADAYLRRIKKFKTK